LSFLARSGYLNSAILNACGSGNIYAAAVLFRPIVEHNFRHLYIYVKALNENSDAVGERYYGVLRKNEDRQAIYNINKYNKKVYPEVANLNLRNEHNARIRDGAKEFHIDEIFYYLVENNNSHTDLVTQYKKKYLLERVRQYTNLSSSVHGGPFAEATFLTAQKENPDATLNKFASDSFGLHNSLVETTYLFAWMMNESNKDHYEAIKSMTSYS
jgi:hypothetical protein